MSYNYRIYVSESSTAPALTELVETIPGLKVAPGAQIAAPPLFIPVERRGEHLFTIDGPLGLQAEEIPPEVTAIALGINACYEISVEGAHQTAIPAAWRFVKKLAKEASGVGIDLQTDEVWPKPSTRKAPKPAKDAEIDIVSISWYYLVDEAPQDLISQYLKLARKHLPEALPRTYSAGSRRLGTHADGDDALIAAYANEPFWGVRALTTPPVFNVSFNGFQKYKETDVRMVSMDVHRDALHDHRWRDAMREFFVAFAQASRSFFASAEVSRGYFWSGREVRSQPSTTEGAFTCLFAGRWRGLRRWPQWWTWFAGPYKELVQAHMPGKTLTAGQGVFHSLSEEPLDRDALFANMPTSGNTWIPAELTFTSDYVMSPEPAATIPPRLLEVHPQAP